MFYSFLYSGCILIKLYIIFCELPHFILSHRVISSSVCSMLIKKGIITSYIIIIQDLFIFLSLSLSETVIAKLCGTAAGFILVFICPYLWKLHQQTWSQPFFICQLQKSRKFFFRKQIILIDFARVRKGNMYYQSDGIYLNHIKFNINTKNIFALCILLTIINTLLFTIMYQKWLQDHKAAQLLGAGRMNRLYRPSKSPQLRKCSESNSDRINYNNFE